MHDGLAALKGLTFSFSHVLALAHLPPCRLAYDLKRRVPRSYDVKSTVFPQGLSFPQGCGALNFLSFPQGFKPAQGLSAG